MMTHSFSMETDADQPNDPHYILQLKLVGIY